MTTAQGVGHHVLGPRDELGNQHTLPRFQSLEEELCLLVESSQERSPRFLTYDSAVVLPVNTPTVRPRRVVEVLKTQTDGTQLAKVDRKGALLDRPMNRNKTIVEIGAPPEIRGVRPKEQVRMLDLQGDALKKVVGFQPPQEVRLV